MSTETPIADWVQTYNGQQIVQRPLAKFKKERAPFMLEIWRYEKPEKEINVYVRTFLWLTGSASLPNQQGLIQKNIDELLKTCPHCNEVFLPPTKSFRKVPSTGRGRPEHWVVCLGCQRQFPRRMLIDNHTFPGTYDSIGAHLNWRYNQLRKVMMRRVADDKTFADTITAPEAADVLYRVLRQNMAPRVESFLNRELGAEDRFWKAVMVNNKEAAYIFADDLASDLSKGTLLEHYFRNLLRA